MKNGHNDIDLSLITVAGISCNTSNRTGRVLLGSVIE
jgi:hypothetical protein